MGPDGPNPSRHVERYGKRKRGRSLSADELAGLGNVLAAIKLLVLTGARRGEGLEWQRQWVGFERGKARLPDSMIDPKTLHLSPPLPLEIPRPLAWAEAKNRPLPEQRAIFVQ